jgi:hypothetical protein
MVLNLAVNQLVARNRAALVDSQSFDSEAPDSRIVVYLPVKGPADFFSYADMAELADALGSGPSDRKVVEVRVLLSAPNPLSY